jgi:hypothetical protein
MILDLTHPRLISSALAEGAFNPTQLVMLALAIGGLTIVMLATYRKNRRSRQKPTSTVRDQYRQVNRQAVVTKDVDQAMVELDRLARQIHGQIDTRFAKLEAVIRDADQRIVTLSRLTNAPRGSAPLDVTLESQAPPVTVPASVAASAPISDQRYDAIYRMSDGGTSTVDIARKSGKTKGEVELILALRDSRRQGTEPAPSVR